VVSGQWSVVTAAPPTGTETLGFGSLDTAASRIPPASIRACSRDLLWSVAVVPAPVPLPVAPALALAAAAAAVAAVGVVALAISCNSHRRGPGNRYRHTLVASV
jgi:hypothetical protein